jgi:hypothetical protein
LVVERLDVVVAQPAQTNTSEGGHDVALHVALISAVGAGSELQLLGRQPLTGEIGTEGQRTHGVGTALLFGGEPRRQVLCRGAVGAGRVPPSPLAAGDRVEPLVDDGVEPSPPLRHVAIHGVLLPFHRTASIRWNVR